MNNANDLSDFCLEIIRYRFHFLALILTFKVSGYFSLLLQTMHIYMIFTRFSIAKWLIERSFLIGVLSLQTMHICILYSLQFLIGK